MIYLVISVVTIYVFTALLINRSFRRKFKSRTDRVIALTGGGTAGHVYPLIALYEEFKGRNRDVRFIYIGTKERADSQIVPRENIPFFAVLSAAYPGIRNPIKLTKFSILTLAGTLQALQILIRCKPFCIISTGGYASAPALLAGIVLRKLFRVPVKLYLHEQNTIPGQANHALGRWVDVVFVSFPQTLRFFPKKGVYSGYPVRKSIFSERATSLDLTIPKGRMVIFVFGGSLGARTINRALVDALPYLFPYRNRIFVIHGLGLSKTDVYDAERDTLERISRLPAEIRNELPSFYHARRYFHSIGEIYRRADLIVSRSGAGTINEIASLGKPALLIPKGGLPGDHQVMNARAMKYAGAAEVLYEDVKRDQQGNHVEFVDPQELAQTILRLIHDKAQLTTMGTAAKNFFRHKASQLMADYIEGNFTESGIRIEALLPARDLVPVPIGSVIGRLAGEYSKNPANYNLTDVLDEDEIRYYRYAASRLLYHPKWPMRNIGVKAVGYLLQRDKIPELVRMICDRTRVSRWLRLLGGDFVEVGFIRRNAIRSIIVMDVFDRDVEIALKTALKDPYYEVRAEACRAVQHFANHLAGRDEWLRLILELFCDPCFEVVVEAEKALGRIGIDGRALDPLLRMGTHPLWQVRHAALEGILYLLERRVICPSPELLEGLRNFILTSTDFIPLFTIKETYRKIERLCERRTGSDQSDPLRSQASTAGGKE
ncbi:glycosyltransferase [Thermodesulforhabdus norvegica]|uniref:UDP-N-acetylglucosamine--N-acetylmuramyl-(pentapeptide) pyrophosphoryl-undecaprenol N-acetylglucosamine transferase n=1 Tax=Thermodesulforhabdus norvegica TaxID=39841 RepID=A0A1I4UYX7_9BACT|nr:glycosyltransferase [Thermodesulforhabdus norvegica]SFM93973.1 UDP-N-acetylglucosamine--N-acetylmuramyl-(pentapeptide) pyrophosphoryl-undecaprenol N-acetylglucosamine transferase [Thermodesulforhabdus norvegica]